MASHEDAEQSLRTGKIVALVEAVGSPTASTADAPPPAVASRAIYLDVFSCAPYDPEDAAQFAKEFFKASQYEIHVTHRK